MKQMRGLFDIESNLILYGEDKINELVTKCQDKSPQGSESNKRDALSSLVKGSN